MHEQAKWLTWNAREPLSWERRNHTACRALLASTGLIYVSRLQEYDKSDSKIAQPGYIDARQGKHSCHGRSEIFPFLF